MQEENTAQSIETSTPTITCPVVEQVKPTEKVVEVVSRKTNNTQRNQHKTVATENAVSVAKTILKLKQADLTDKIKAKGESLGLSTPLTRGRLSNMCNGNCNLTENIEKVCIALLEDAGWTTKEKEWKAPVREEKVAEVA